MALLHITLARVYSVASICPQVACDWGSEPPDSAWAAANALVALAGLVADALADADGMAAGGDATAGGDAAAGSSSSEAQPLTEATADVSFKTSSCKACWSEPNLHTVSNGRLSVVQSSVCTVNTVLLLP